MGKVAVFFLVVFAAVLVAAIEFGQSAATTIVLIASAILAVVLFTMQPQKQSDQDRARIHKEELSAWLTTIPDFAASAELSGRSWRLLLDDTRSKLLLIDWDATESRHRFMTYSDVVSSEIVEDGVTVTAIKTNRGSQLLGAAVGNALLGPAGLIVGGLSSTHTATEQSTVNSVSLRLVLDDTSSPERVSEFLPGPTKKGSPSHRMAQQQARHWQSVFEVLIRRADMSRSTLSSSPSSVADELTKLLALKNAGVLDEAEFARQKARLLQ